MNQQPPLGAGNPLGMEGVEPRMGPCMYGRLLQPNDGPPVQPCSSLSESVLVVYSGEVEGEGEETNIPLCTPHAEFFKKILGKDGD